VNNILKYNLNIFGPFLFGAIVLSLLDCHLDLANIFSAPDSNVYNSVFSTIVQVYLALVAFLGMLVVFKFQRDEERKKQTDHPATFAALGEAQRELSFDLKKFTLVCLWNAGLAFVAIPLIPFFDKVLWLGPAYLGGNMFLSIWLLYLSYPIIQKVLRLTP